MPELSPYLIVPITTIIVSQIIKFAIHAFSNEIDFSQLIKIGGTPNSRIAAVVALVATALAVDGIGSSVAGLTVFLGGLYVWEKLGQVTRRQLAYSAGVGLLSGVILSVNYWKDSVNWLFETPTSTQITWEFIIFGLLLVVAEIMSFMTRRKSMRKLPTSRKLNRAFRLSLTLPAVIGLVIAFAQRETLGVIDTRIWTLLIAIWIVAASAWFWWSVYRHARAHLAEEAAHFKKTKTKAKSKTKTKKKKSKRKK